MRQGLPLVEQARVGLTDDLPEPLDEVGEFLVLLRLGHALTQGAVRVGEVAQDDALAAREVVEADEIAEAPGVLVHLPHDGLG